MVDAVGRGPLRELLLADVARQWEANGTPGRPDRWRDVLVQAGNLRFWPVLLYRLSSASYSRGSGLGARFFSVVNQLVFGVEIALRLEIGPGLYIPHPGGIVLGANSIGRDATIYHGVTLGAAVLDTSYRSDHRPTVGDGVVIASGAKVLGGVTVGDRAVIAANAVVLDDVAAQAVVGGVPAKVLGQRGEGRW